MARLQAALLLVCVLAAVLPAVESGPHKRAKSHGDRIAIAKALGAHSFCPQLDGRNFSALFHLKYHNCY